MAGFGAKVGARSRTARTMIVSAIAAAIVAPFGVWFLGFDPLWSIAMVLAVGPVAAMVASLASEDVPPWDPPRRETPRGVRLVMATMERSLAACDRLARATAVRRLQTFLHAERDDRLARSTIARRMRALLATELQLRGIDPADRTADDAVVALFGPESLTILQPHDGIPVTTAAIATCLDAVERLETESPRPS